MRRENSVNIRRYHKTVPGVPKMTPAHCFLLALEAIKWPSEKHQYSEKCIYFETLLFMPSLKLVLERF